MNRGLAPAEELATQAEDVLTIQADLESKYRQTLAFATKWAESKFREHALENSNEHIKNLGKMMS